MSLILPAIKARFVKLSKTPVSPEAEMVLDIVLIYAFDAVTLVTPFFDFRYRNPPAARATMVIIGRSFLSFF
jgi:hypothetical protein